MRGILTKRLLWKESGTFIGTGGTSSENCQSGFRPAFLDSQTGVVYPCCHEDGRPAAMHLFDGLPPELVVRRSPSGRATAVRGSLVAGFVQEGRFFTRAEAATWITQETQSVAAPLPK